MATKIVIPRGIELPHRTAWWACGELNSKRKLAKQRETDLIKTRKKLEDDLNQFGDRKCAERTRVCELLIDTQRAIDATRNEIKWLADQMQDAFDHANQPGFWEDEEKLAAMLGEPPAKVEPIDELIAAAAGVQVEAGEVGEPGGADAAKPRGSGRSKKSEPAPVERLQLDDLVQVVKRFDGEIVAEGTMVQHVPEHGFAFVLVKGERRKYELERDALKIVRAPASPQAAPQVGEPDEPGVAGMIRGGEVVDGSTGKPAKAKSEKPAKGAKKAKRA